MAPAVELPIVLFDGSKHMSKMAVSQIRSHAMRDVQRRKFETQQPQPVTELPTPESLATHDSPRPPSTSPSDEPIVVSTRTRKRSHASASPELQYDTAKRQEHDHSECAHRYFIPASHVTYCYPSNPDPLILELIKHCYDVWQWHAPSSALMHYTLKHEGLYHSILSLAYYTCKYQKSQAIEHENATIRCVLETAQGLEKRDQEQQRQALGILARCIVRLVMAQLIQADLEAAINHLQGLASILPTYDTLQGLDFGEQIRYVIGSILLPFATVWDSVPEQLRCPFGKPCGSAVEEVTDCGYRIDLNHVSPMAKGDDFLTEELSDIVAALVTVYVSSRASDSVLSTQARGVAQHGVKLGLRLIHIGPITNARDEVDVSIKFQTALRLVLLMCIWMACYNVFGVPQMMWSSLSRLKALLSPNVVEEIMKSSRTSHTSKETLAWMLVMLGTTSTEQDEKEYYAKILRRPCFDLVANWPGGMQTSCLTLIWPTKNCPDLADDFLKLVKTTDTLEMTSS